MTNSTFRPSLFLRGQGVETESPNIIFMIGSPGNQSSSLSTFQKSLIILKPVVVESGLLWIMTRISSEAILRIENKKPHTMQKILPLLLSLRKFQGFWELWTRNCGWDIHIWPPKWPRIYFSKYTVHTYTLYKSFISFRYYKYILPIYLAYWILLNFYDIISIFLVYLFIYFYFLDFFYYLLPYT